MIAQLFQDLLIILAAGFVAGVVCRRIGVSLLVGYLVAGAVIGHGGFGLLATNAEQVEYLAKAGALLLLFAIGIEFSLEELARLSRFMVVGGLLQTVLVAVPVGLVCRLAGAGLGASVVIAAATAQSSTVLVYRALTEWGHTASPPGRRAIGILLFQDVALVPLMLLLPLLTGRDIRGGWSYVLLGTNSILLTATVPLLRSVLTRWVIPLLGNLRSVELVVLLSLIILVGFCMAAHLAGLPPAIGAFAAGLVLSDNRLTRQVDAVVLPYRESFGALFFISLGTYLDLRPLAEGSAWLLAGLLAVLLVKASAAAVALRVTGLTWRAAAGMGLGLVQLGELSFVLLSEGLHVGLIDAAGYNRMLFIAMGSLLVTPELLRVGLQWIPRGPSAEFAADTPTGRSIAPPKEAIVIGIGPMGRQAVSQLELMGVDVCLVDQSPVNLHPFAQQGFRTVCGDGRDADVLRRADAEHARLAVVCVPDDQAALVIVRGLRNINPACTVIVRCRYQATRSSLQKAGAHTVISEEAEASTSLQRLLERVVQAEPYRREPRTLAPSATEPGEESGTGAEPHGQ